MEMAGKHPVNAMLGKQGMQPIRFIFFKRGIPEWFMKNDACQPIILVFLKIFRQPGHLSIIHLIRIPELAVVQYYEMNALNIESVVRSGAGSHRVNLPAHRIKNIIIPRHEIERTGQ